MVKQLKLINDFYYCRPGKGALSSNTCYISIRFQVNITYNKHAIFCVQQAHLPTTVLHTIFNSYSLYVVCTVNSVCYIVYTMNTLHTNTIHYSIHYTVYTNYKRS